MDTTMTFTLLRRADIFDQWKRELHSALHVLVAHKFWTQEEPPKFDDATDPDYESRRAKAYNLLQWSTRLRHQLLIQKGWEVDDLNNASPTEIYETICEVIPNYIKSSATSFI